MKSKFVELTILDFNVMELMARPLPIMLGVTT